MKAVRIQDETEIPDGMAELYETSFPKNERIPWQTLVRRAENGAYLHAWYEGEQLTAMTFMVRFDDLMYLAYFAVMPDQREKGYGTRILEKLRSLEPDCRMIADIEDANRPGCDQDERLRRRQFYLRGGFTPCNVHFHLYGVDYELISAGGAVTEAEWSRMAGLLFAEPVVQTLRFYPAA